jgi:hypothetical protein
MIYMRDEACTFLRKGKFMISCPDRHALVLGDLKNREERATAEGLISMVFSAGAVRRLQSA